MKKLLCLPLMFCLMMAIPGFAEEGGAAQDTPVAEASLDTNTAAATEAPKKKGIVPVPPYTGPLDKRLRLTGDWGGVRTDLAENGVQIYVDWFQVYYGGVSGGVHPRGLGLERNKFILKGLTGSLKPQDFLDLRRARRAEKSDPDMEYTGAFDYTLLFDTAAMGLWQGGILMLHGETLYGGYPNTETGALLPLSLRTALPLNEYPVSTLSHVMYTQYFSPEVSVAIGKLPTFDITGLPFASGNGTKDFMNFALQLNPQLALAVPYSALGIMLDVKPSENLDFRMIAVDTEGDARVSGFDTIFEGGTTYGATLMLKTNFFDKPGQQVIGAVYSDGTFFNVSDIVDISWNVGSERQNSGFGPTIEGINKVQDTWAVAWAGMQYLSYEEETKRGTALFGRFGLADSDSNPVEQFYAMGFWGRGPFKSRPKDEWGLAYFHVGMGDIPKRLQIGDEYGAELFYKFMVTPWFDITPDVQVINPGLENADTLFTVGVRTNVRF